MSTAQFKINNLGPNSSVDEIITFLGFNDTEESRNSCSVALSACRTFAFVNVPEDLASRVTERNGETLNGVKVNIVGPGVLNSTTVVESAGLGLKTLAEIASGAPHLNQPDQQMNTEADECTVKFVSIDTTRCNDPFNVPTHATVVLALGRQFPKAQDPDRVIIRQTGRFEGIWRIESQNTDLYAGSQFLIHEGHQVGFVEIKKETFRKDIYGNVTRERVRQPRSQGARTADDNDDELLVTLHQANTSRFSFVSNETLLHSVVSMGVGELKKAPQPQRHRGSDEQNGNKFFVLKNVNEETAQNIPSHFMFIDEKLGAQRMWLNHRLRKRFCSFCSEEHVAECPTRALYNQLCAERKLLKEASGNKFNVHVVSDSTLRYAEQECLATDVHAMSGATTGNLLNAVDVDLARKDVQNLIIVAGQNELHSQLTDEEFLVCLKKKEERLRILSKDKTVAILKPPPQTRLDAMEQAKEVVFHEHLAVLDEEIPNLKVWANPLEAFDEDAGRHPNPEQTNSILNFLDQKAKEDLGVSIFLESGPNDLITTKRKYRGVKALYKYGCGACSDKSRNKWWSICTNCSTAAGVPDADVQLALNILLAKADEIRERDTPPLTSASKSSYRDRSPMKEGDSSSNVEYDNVAPKKRVKFCNNVDGN